MPRPVRVAVCLVLLLVPILFLGSSARAAVPAVTAVVEGRDAATGAPVLTVVGTGLSAAKTVALLNPNESPVAGTTLLLRSRTTLVLALPAGLARGAYILRLAYGKSLTAQDHPLNLNGADGSALFQGTVFTGAIPAEGAGPRMMWYPAKGAFRVGQVSGTQWDDANIGFNSVAMGADTTADFAECFAMGYGTAAGGLAATAMGQSTTAFGPAATAMGKFTSASGLQATAMGLSTTASGFWSTSTGSATSATGDGSFSMGFNTTAQAYGSLVLGQYNVVAGNIASWTATDPVLVVGNGTSITPLNAFTLLKNGNLTIAGNLTQASDARLKCEIAPLSGVLPRLASIRGVSYRLKDERTGPAGRQIGLLAQEVRVAFPELVHEDTQGTLSVAYGNLSAVLLEAVKEQQATIEGQKAEIERQRNDLATLAQRLERLEALVGKSPK